MTENTITTAIIAISGAITSISRSLIKWVALVCIAYFLFRSVACLSGKITIADFAVNVLANVKIQYLVSYSFGIGGLVYGGYQRRLRKSRIKTLSEYATKLEQQIHPDRLSSEIRPDGTTPSDQPPL